VLKPFCPLAGAWRRPVFGTDPGCLNFPQAPSCILPVTRFVSFQASTRNNPTGNRNHSTQKGRLDFMKNVRGVVLALFAVTLGSMAALAQEYNTATGYYALADVTDGSYDTADGYVALLHDTTGSWNTATGTSAMQFNTAGNYNTADGEVAHWPSTRAATTTRP
jgi:hypothetical protein